MNRDSKSLVRRTIKRQAVDRIPAGELCIDDAVVSAFTGTARVGFEQRRQVADRLGLDLICLGAQYGPGSESGALPSAHAVDLNAVQEWAEQTDRFIFVLLDGGFQWGLKQWGFQKFLTMVMRQSADVPGLLQHVETLNRRLTRRAADLGADGVVIADDIAYRNGLLLPPDRIKELFLPSLARQTEACHAAGLAAFFHSDGNLNAILEDIAGSGFDGLQCIESAAGMDLAEIRADYGHKLCFWGNLDPACMAEDLSVNTIDARVEAVLASGSRNGGLIFGTSSGLYQGMQLGSIDRAYKVVRMKGKYHARPKTQSNA
jgi:uroporphyrinogen decarboxylase